MAAKSEDWTLDDKIVEKVVHNRNFVNFWIRPPSLTFLISLRFTGVLADLFSGEKTPQSTKKCGTISKLRFLTIQKKKTVPLFKSVWIDQLLLLSVKVFYFLGSTVPLVTSQFLNSWPVSSTSLPSKISNSSRLPLMKGIFFIHARNLEREKQIQLIPSFLHRFDLVVQNSIQEAKRDPCYFSKHRANST